MSRNGMRHRTGRKAGVANSLMQSSPTFWSSRGSWKGEAGGSCSRDQWICLPEFAEGLLPGPSQLTVLMDISCNVQSLSRVQLFATLWTAVRQASLSFTLSLESA